MAYTVESLAKSCLAGGGARYRAIGDRELVNTGVYNTKDSVSYAFFSYGEFAKSRAIPAMATCS